MDNSPSLHTILEVTDLLAMIEDLTEPDRIQQVSAASWAGMRITLRDTRARLLESHRALSHGHQERQGSQERHTAIRAQGERTSTEASPVSSRRAANDIAPNRDLKSALEKFVDRP
ncbi:hypothetical protein MRY87_02875 [bacterium]|nr:hypothetical protein [bacterium]